MKTCDEYQEMISAYTDNELADSETSKLFYHLGECKQCREMLKSMMHLRIALHEAEFMAMKKGDHKSIWKKKFAISYPVAASIAMVIMISSLFLAHKIAEPPRIVERIQTEYVYLTAYPPVYATTHSSNEIKSN